MVLRLLAVLMVLALPVFGQDQFTLIMGSVATGGGGGTTTDTVHYENVATAMIEYNNPSFTLNVAKGSGNNRGVIVKYFIDGAASSPSVTVGGSSCTQYGTATDHAGTGYYYCWYILDANLGAAGDKTVAVNGVSGQAGRVVAYSLYDVNQTTPIRTEGNTTTSGTSVSTTIASCTQKELLIDMTDVSGSTTGITLTDGAGQIRRATGQYFSAASCTQRGATGNTSISYSWTGSQAVGMRVIAVQSPNP